MAEKQKSRKRGRNLAFCKAYRMSNQRERNKARRLIRHLNKKQNDKVAIVALKVCLAVLPVKEAKNIAAGTTALI